MSDFDFIKPTRIYLILNIFSSQNSDVFGAPKPEGDIPESLIPKPDPTPKIRTRTNPDVSRS